LVAGFQIFSFTRHPPRQEAEVALQAPFHE